MYNWMTPKTTKETMYVYLDLRSGLAVLLFFKSNVLVFLPLWSVAQCQDKLLKDESKIEVFEDSVDNWSCTVSKWKGSAPIGDARSSDKIHDHGRGKPKCSCSWTSDFNRQRPRK